MFFLGRDSDIFLSVFVSFPRNAFSTLYHLYSHIFSHSFRFYLMHSFAIFFMCVCANSCSSISSTSRLSSLSLSPPYWGLNPLCFLAASLSLTLASSFQTSLVISLPAWYMVTFLLWLDFISSSALLNIYGSFMHHCSSYQTHELLFGFLLLWGTLKKNSKSKIQSCSVIVKWL